MYSIKSPISASPLPHLDDLCLGTQSQLHKCIIIGCIGHCETVHHKLLYDHVFLALYKYFYMSLRTHQSRFPFRAYTANVSTLPRIHFSKSNEEVIFLFDFLQIKNPLISLGKK